MPLRVYACDDCGREHELLRHHSETEDPTCPDCGSAAMRAQFSAFAVATATSPEPGPCAGGSGPCPGGACPFA